MEEKPRTIKIYFCFLKREKDKVEPFRGVLPGPGWRLPGRPPRVPPPAPGPGPLVGAGFSAARGRRWWDGRAGSSRRFSIPSAGGAEGRRESLDGHCFSLPEFLLVGL